MKKTIIFLFIIFTDYISAIDWEINGPGKENVTSMFIEGNHIYTCTNGRVYSSSNMGENWKLLNNYFQYPTFSNNTGILFKENKIFVGSIDGLFTSTDSGMNWVEDSIESKSFSVYDLVNYNNDIYIVVLDGIYKSKDYGNNWVNFSPKGMSGAEKITIEGDNIYVGCNVGNGKRLALWISKDNGNNWTSYFDTLNGLNGAYLTEFNTLGASANNIYLSTNDGFFISTNGGEFWKKLDDPFFDLIYPTTIYAFSDTVFIGSDMGLYYSIDRSNSWIENFFYKPVNQIIKIQDTMFIASDGLGISYDFGKNFAFNAIGKGSALVWNIIENKNDLLAGTYFEGVYSSKDNGTTWNRFEKIPDVDVLDLKIIDNSIVFTNYGPGKGILNFSSDFGNTWLELNDSCGIQNIDIKCLESDLIKKIFFAGNKYGLYKSEDLGKTWILVHNDFINVEIKGIHISNDTIYVYDNVNLYISTDYGKKWVLIRIPDIFYNELTITSLAISNNNIILGTQKYKNKAGFYVSNNFGKTWFGINDTTNHLQIQDIIAYNNYVFSCTNKGLFFSSHCGETWSKPENNLEFVNLSCLFINGIFLYVGTAEGVFRAKLSDFGITDVSDEISEVPDYLYSYPPYPSPTSEIVKVLVYYDTKTDLQEDEISVVDIYGNEIANKNDINIDEQNNYSAIISWDTKGVADGVYLILITHGSKKRAIKIMVRR